MDTLRRAQVATSVIVFGDYPYMLKGFNTSVPKALEKLACLNELGGTSDFMAVRYAHSLLHNRPESRKICFVITDGEGDMDSTREQCLSGTRLGITTIGVGIDLNVSNVYPQAVTVTDLADLGQVSFSKIKLAA
jgi:nitric oxide reductase activation protein